MHFRKGTFGVKCWRCGKKKISETIAALLRIPHREAIWEMRKFTKKGNIENRYFETQIEHAKDLIWPGGCESLQNVHRKLLESRNFDSYELERIWKLLGTNHIDPNYRWRIVIPLYWKNRAISYQALDITGQHKQKYKAAPPAHEVIPHWEMLYGADQALITNSRKVVVVEGVTDVWRLGPGAVATYGVEWNNKQAIMLSKNWEEIFLFYDPDEAGEKGGLSLYNFLRGFGNNVYNMKLETGAEDPGALSNEDGRYIMENIFKIRKRGKYGT